MKSNITASSSSERKRRRCKTTEYKSVRSKADKSPQARQTPCNDISEEEDMFCQTNTSDSDVKDPHRNTRAKIAGLYKAFCALSFSDYKEEGSNEDNVNNEKENAINSIIKASQGSLAEKRLAARLVPRFLISHPERLSEMTDVLLSLCRCRVGSTKEEQEICDKMRHDVLTGLISVCDQAMKTHPNPQEINSKVIISLLKELKEVHKKLYSGSRPNGLNQNQTPAEKDFDFVLEIFKRAFCICPMEVFLQCVEAWKKEDWIFSVSASVLFERVLLAIPRHSSEVENSKDHSLNDREALAIQVLRKHPEVIRWLREMFNNLVKSGNTPSNKIRLLENLMQRIEQCEDMCDRKRPWERERDTSVSSSHHHYSNKRSRDAFIAEHPFSSLPNNPSPNSITSNLTQKKFKTEKIKLSEKHSGKISAGVSMTEDQLLKVNFSPCLFFNPLLRSVTPSHLYDICSHYGEVEKIIFPPDISVKKAIVFFTDIEFASRCLHALHNHRYHEFPRRFCSHVPSVANETTRPVSLSKSSCIWVAGPTDYDLERDVVGAVFRAGLPFPRHIVRHCGTEPGLLLELQSLALVEPISKCLTRFHRPKVKIAQREASSCKINEKEIAIQDPPEKSLKISKVSDHREAKNSDDIKFPEQCSNIKQEPGLPPLPKYSPPPLPAGTPPEEPCETVNDQVACLDKNQQVELMESKKIKINNIRQPMVTGKEENGMKIFWKGKLAKSGVLICDIICHSTPGRAGTCGVTKVDMHGWPTILDVLHRVDLKVTIEQMYKSIANKKKSYMHISPKTEQDRPMVLEFIKYLKDRKRAGVVQLQGSNSKGIGDRNLYLMPPTEDVKRLILCGEEMRRGSLICFIVPCSNHSKNKE